MVRTAGNTLARVTEGSRVLIIRIRSLGDCVLTTPAIEILANARPDLKIGVVVEPAFAAVFEGNPAVAAILEPSYLSVFRWRPALCLNFHGGRRSRWMTAASRARIRAGFAHHRGSGVYNVPIPRAQEILGEERAVHTAEHLASAMFHLGCERKEIPRARLFAAPSPRKRPYAVIHPSAAAAYKTWRADGFLAAARHIAGAHALEPVFIGGPADDLGAFAGFECVKGAPLEQVKSLISGASLFLGNDSGPAHIAAAFDVPLVVLFGRPEHEAVWAPWRAAAARTLVDASGIAAIRTVAVLAALDQVRAMREGARR